ncbi:MAG: CRISPR-associated endonuclease Cas1 [Mariprofundaceae bacterium]|nr:CRISPR-associated endonuclease Cas1 [Mariprofundaceae bacterium]
MKKVVYLGESQKKVCVSLDGPALRIQRYQKANVWLPLSQISYVVCSHQTQWKTDALLACMQTSILLIFSSTHGKVAGYCVGEIQPSLEMSEVWLSYWEHHHQGESFYQWHENTVRHSIMMMAKHLHIPNPRLHHNGAMQDLTHKVFDQFSQHQVHKIQEELQELLHAWLVSELFELGWPLEVLCAAQFRPDLSMCMVDHLHWENQIIVIQLLQKYPQTIQREHIIAAFEQHKHHFKKQFSSYWHDFYHWLAMHHSFV